MMKHRSFLEQSHEGNRVQCWRFLPIISGYMSLNYRPRVGEMPRSTNKDILVISMQVSDVILLRFSFLIYSADEFVSKKKKRVKCGQKVHREANFICQFFETQREKSANSASSRQRAKCEKHSWSLLRAVTAGVEVAPLSTSNLRRHYWNCSQQWKKCPALFDWNGFFFFLAAVLFPSQTQICWWFVFWRWCLFWHEGTQSDMSWLKRWQSKSWVWRK